MGTGSPLTLEFLKTGFELDLLGSRQRKNEAMEFEAAGPARRRFREGKAGHRLTVFEKIVRCFI